MTISLLFYLLVLVVISFGFGVICKLIKLPPLVGYLISGLILGSFFKNLIQQETIVFLSELGVVLLLFTLGVEFSFAKLKSVAKTTIPGGLFQMILTTVVFMPVLIFLDFSPFEAFFAAAAFSLSSTAIVVKLLTDRGELETVTGEILVGWLILQDLAVLPLMLILSSLGKALSVSGGFDLFSVFVTIILAGSIVTIALISGRQVIPWVMGKIASLNSRELLVIAIFAVAVGGALGSTLLGLSPALGAFLAGMLISQTLVNHAVFSEIRPLRDIFSLLFFASLGLVLPSGFLLAHVVQILVLTLIVLIVKFTITFVLTVSLGHHTKTSFIVALGLTEVGEFAFILAAGGQKTGVITTNAYAYIVSVAILSMLVFPPLFEASGRLYHFFHAFVRKHLHFLHLNLARMSKMPKEELSYRDHVVLCGYGRVGKYIGRAFDMAHIPYVVVEYNHHKARELKEKGVPVVYGDPADIDILDYAQVDRARAVVIAIPDLTTQKEVIVHSLTLNKNIEIYCRTHHEDEQKILKALGVTAVIQPEFEASLSITHKILRSFGQKAEDIAGKISRLKIEHGLG